MYQLRHTDHYLERIDRIRVLAGTQLRPDQRALLGQFMTPGVIAQFMARMLTHQGSQVELLDAGAGTGALLGAGVVTLCQRPVPPERIRITAYEIDQNLQALLHQTLDVCAEVCASHGIDFAYEVHATDFIHAAVTQLSTPLFGPGQRFNCALLNPPYRKIQTNSPERRALQQVGIETSNLYTGFLALATLLLVPEGELVAITPRSFCNGSYFRPFREFFLQQMALRQLHIFESRDQAFEVDGVLQENIILSAVKSTIPPEQVLITTATDSDDDMPTMRFLPYHQVVHPGDPEVFIHLITDDVEEIVATHMHSLSATLHTLNLSVSTGRVVDFRASAFLRQKPDSDTVPLIYPTHIDAFGITWPKLESRKPNAIHLCQETQALMIPNDHYVLIKRFSSKEERRRVVACVYDPQQIKASYIGIENHLNYIHCHGHGISPDLAHGLSAFLNSTLVDSYVRQFNGHTQINATDLRNMRYPTHEQLISIGQRIGSQQLSQQALDTLVMQELGFMSTPTHLDPIQIKQRIEESLGILAAIGLPRAQRNERSALTLLALLGLEPTTSWSESCAPLCGITPMMEFFAQKYGKQYKPNTRETVRRQTVHQFLEAGLILANPDDPARPINSPKTVYQITEPVLELLRSYGSEAWEQQLNAFLTNHETLRHRYAQERALHRVPIRLPSGEIIQLSPGGQNVLIQAILEEFASRFVPGGEVWYVGDTEEKLTFFAAHRFQEVGITLETHGKMPDVVLYDPHRRWLVLVEAVTSHGPIDPKRRHELQVLFATSAAGLVFVTTFLSRQALKEHLTSISWETEVWVADAPDHLIHFNGERFLDAR